MGLGRVKGERSKINWDSRKKKERKKTTTPLGLGRKRRGEGGGKATTLGRERKDVGKRGRLSLNLSQMNLQSDMCPIYIPPKLKKTLMKD